MDEILKHMREKDLLMDKSLSIVEVEIILNKRLV